MATARKSASTREQLAVSQIADFKARMGGVMELPSGLVVKAKNPGGLQAFIANGTIPNSLLSIVQTTLNAGEGVDAANKAREVANDVESLADMMKLMDIVVSHVIVEPKVYLKPTQEDVERHNLLHPRDTVSTPDELMDEERLYIDEIGDLDKQFLFQWMTGGTRDLEKFREQHEVSLAAVSAGKGSEDRALTTSRAGKK